MRYTLEHTDFILSVHEEGTCWGDVCCIHKKTDHELRKFPQVWHRDKMYRAQQIQDERYVFWPDPDEVGSYDVVEQDYIDNVILSNEVTCGRCENTIYSMHVHDFVTCECGSVSVDGGFSYLKRSFTNGVEYTDNSVSLKDVIVLKAVN